VARVSARGLIVEPCNDGPIALRKGERAMRRAALFGSVLGLLLVAGAADAASITFPRPCANTNYRLSRDSGPELVMQCLQGTTYVTVLTIVDPTCPKTSWADSKDVNGNITVTCKGPRLTR
jgi:hypothetical protein